MSDETTKPLNPRQEAFCQNVAEGMSTAQAARLAGYSPRSARKIGWELLEKPDISVRIAEIRATVRESGQQEITELIGQLQEIRASAKYSGHYGAAVRAVETIARLKGHLGQRRRLPPDDEPPNDSPGNLPADG